MSGNPKEIGKSARTRALILSVAEELFGSRGFAGTSTQAIAEEAGLTRGALYFHFEDKLALFRAVFESLEARLTRRLAAGAAKEASAWGGLVAGCRVYLDACLEEGFSRTVLLDAPTALGWEEWRSLEEQYALGLMKGALQACIDEKAIKKQPVPPLAQMLLACLNEAGMVIARTDDKKGSRRELGRAIGVILEGLRAEPGKRIRI